MANRHMKIWVISVIKEKHILYYGEKLLHSLEFGRR